MGDLVERGHEVLNVDRAPSPEASLPESPVPLLVADLTDFGRALEALSGGNRLPGIGLSCIPETSYALSKVLGEEIARKFSRWTGVP